MASKKDAPKDIFMQFKGIADTAEGTTFTAAEFPTGLSIRGALLWLMHVVEFFLPQDSHSVINGSYELALSTKKGLTAVPNPLDDGVVAYHTSAIKEATNGGAYIPLVERHDFLPPVPLAAPILYLYGDGTNAAYTGGIGVRVGFTTEELDAATYTEVAETWGW